MLVVLDDAEGVPELERVDGGLRAAQVEEALAVLPDGHAGVEGPEMAHEFHGGVDADHGDGLAVVRVEAGLQIQQVLIVLVQDTVPLPDLPDLEPRPLQVRQQRPRVLPQVALPLGLALVAQAHHHAAVHLAALRHPLHHRRHVPGPGRRLGHRLHGPPGRVRGRSEVNGWGLVLRRGGGVVEGGGIVVLVVVVRGLDVGVRPGGGLARGGGLAEDSEGEKQEEFHGAPAAVAQTRGEDRL
mmetsp:Transcript_48048/g.117868  ORF Transcript_48048/g.117868 Transcript_48048/m.117868 type:complete len:241 (+) Transcript_48048:822-1544(+)